MNIQTEVEGALLPAIPDAFELWLRERHQWLQTAAARMIKTRTRPDEQAIADLARICVLEASKAKTTEFETIEAGALAQATEQPKVRLQKLTEVTGVNAIKNGATLDFGSAGLAVIYGLNGSGKSGYSRLIKQICGSRAKEDLHRNVFDPDSPAPSSTVHVMVGEKVRETVWTADGNPIPHLKNVHLFDSTVASLYMGPKNEATYEPSRMRFVSSLIDACDRVSESLNGQKRLLVSKMPPIPVDLSKTHAAAWLTRLRAGTTEAKVTFTLKVKGVPSTVRAESILSEGERRIITLAAFLADITGSGQPTPFVFDDPISSLDQDFEERVVARLVSLAKDRQVIVFTHRLSLLVLVETAVKKLREKAATEQKNSPVELLVTSLRRLDKNVGLVTDLSIRDAKPERAINRLRDETLKQLRKLHDNADIEAYEEKAKAFCSDFRILVERCVESVLLNGVLIRFRRELQTYGRIGALAKIEAADCAMIDDLMTRYSTFEHSQSSELPAELPEIGQLETDSEMLSNWIKDFASRADA